MTRTRTMDEMRALCAELGDVLSEHADRHPNLGVVLVTYELDGVDSGQGTNVSWAATRNKDVLSVLRAVLELYEQGLTVEVKGVKN